MHYDFSSAKDSVRLLRLSLCAALALGLGCGGLKRAPLPESLTLSAPATSLRVGSEMQLQLTFKYPPPRGPSPLPVVEWTSSDPSVASVQNGVVRGLKAGGPVTITATVPDPKGNRSNDKKATTAISVTTDRVLTMLRLESGMPTVLVGTTVQVKAQGVYNDGSPGDDLTNQADWSIEHRDIAVVSNTTLRGLVSGLRPGVTMLTARIGSIVGQARVTVTGAQVRLIAVTPVRGTVARDAHLPFTATATLTDNTTLNVTQLASWSSSNEALARVSNADQTRGRATGVAMGNVTITASYGGTSGAASLFVTDMVPLSLAVTPPMPRLGKGATQQMTANVRYPDNTTPDVTSAADWTTSNAAVATVDERGLVRAVGVGMATITAEFGPVKGTSMVTVTDAVISTITVTPAAQMLARGLSQQYAATATYTDGTGRTVTNEVNWATLDPNVASISNGDMTKGLLTAVGVGGTMVTATLDGKVGSVTVTVTGPELSVLAVSPSNRSTAVGGRVSYQARGLFTDGSNRDVTNDVTWGSSAIAVASISNAAGEKGQATGLAPGTTNITATLRGVTETTTLTVTTATLTSVTVIPVSRTVARGTAVRFSANAVYSDNSNADISAIADWSSSAPAIATVTTGASPRGQVTGVAPGSATITASFGGMSASGTAIVTNATLSSLNVAPTNPSVARGSSLDFEASGVFSDGTTQDLTDQVVWTAAMPTVATISNASPNWGRAIAIAPGSTEVRATFGVVSNATTLTVTNATLSSIAIQPATSKIARGTRVGLTATGTYSNGTTQNLTEAVFWSSNKPLVATVSIATGSEGEVTGVAPGTATISAVLGTTSGGAVVEVTSATLSMLAVTPVSPTIAVGTTQAFQATGTFSDNTVQALTDQVTWTSSNAALAVISNVDGSEGVASALAAGNVTITAAFGTTIGTTQLGITNSMLMSIAITPPGMQVMPKGTKRQFTAIGTYADLTTQDLTDSVTWSTGDNAILSVSNSDGSEGLATAVDLGTTTITATRGTATASLSVMVTAATLLSIAVDPPAPMIPKGAKQQLTVTGTYTDNTTGDVTGTASFTSMNGAVASVSAGGEVTGLTEGTSMVKANVGGVERTITVTVSAATLASISLSLSNPSVAKGLTINFEAEGRYSDNSTRDITSEVTWSSSDTTVATISNATGSHGRAFAANVGMSSIRAQLGGIMRSTTMNVTAATLSSIQVDPPAPSIANGTTQNFTANGTYSDLSVVDLTEMVTWAVVAGMPGNATISNAMGSRGRATASAVGQVTITASFGGRVGQATLDITSAVLSGIRIAPLNKTTPLGLVEPFTAEGIYTDGTFQPINSNITWVSNDATVASISNAPATLGQATTLKVGETTIVASHAGFVAATQFRVSPAAVREIEITGLSQMANLTAYQFTATAIYTDGLREDVTTTGTWDSTDATKATVTSTGIVTAAGVGGTVISSTFGGETGTLALTVTGATITQMLVDPSPANVADGQTQQFTPRGRFSDNTTQNLILQAAWASSNTSVASISNAAGSRGLATALNAGTSMISATWNGVSGAATMNVSPKTLSQISVDPQNASVAIGTKRRYTATALYSDNTTDDITTQVNWSVSDASATIDTAGIDIGTVTGVSVGSPSVIAQLSGVTGSATVFITGSTITAINIDPAAASTAAGFTQQFRAIATLSNMTTQDLTDQVTWGSSMPGRATISNDPATRGLATGITAGMTNISAIYNGQVSDFAVLTVTPATLSSIAITSSKPSPVAKGIGVNFTATGTFSNGATQNITNSVTWLSDDATVVNVSSVGPTWGQATTPNMGSTIIRATSGAIQGTMPFTVTAATLNSITVAAVGPATVAVNGTRDFTATANYSDGTTPNITADVTWTTSNAAQAQVSNAVGTKGRVTGLAVGSPSVSAQLGGVSGSATVTVTP